MSAAEPRGASSLQRRRERDQLPERAERSFAMVIALLPDDFKDEFGSEMLLDLEERGVDNGHRFRAWYLRELSGLIVTAIRVRLSRITIGWGIAGLVVAAVAYLWPLIVVVVVGVSILWLQSEGTEDRQR